MTTLAHLVRRYPLTTVWLALVIALAWIALVTEVTA